MELKVGTELVVDESIVLNRKDEPRNYLGFSQIGEECERKLFYSYHLPSKELDARMIRLFKLGHILETEIIAMLRQAGFLIYDLDENGKQFEASYFDGKYKGHPDGIIQGLPESSKPHILEIKTYNDKRFNKLKEVGVKENDPKYFAQLQVNMGAFDLNRSLFVAYNKNTSEMYYERVDYDPFDNAILLAKASRILNYKTDEEIERTYPDKNFYKCKFCEYREVCYRENNKE